MFDAPIKQQRHVTYKRREVKIYKPMEETLMDELGLSYVCQTADRFYAVSNILTKMVAAEAASKKPSQRLLKHIVRCYLRISDNSKARDALRSCMPPAFRDKYFVSTIEDATTSQWLRELMTKIGVAGRK